MRIKLMTAPCLPAGGFRMYELSLDAARLRSSRRPAAVGAGLGPDADRGMTDGPLTRPVRRVAVGAAISDGNLNPKRHFFLPISKVV